jgi:hypothetical protein
MRFQFTVVPLTVSLRSGSIGPSWTDGQVRGAVQEATRIWGLHNVQISMRGIEERSVNMPGLIGGIGATELPRLPSRFNVRGAIAVLTHRLQGNLHAGLAHVGGRICALQWAIANLETIEKRGNDLAHELGHIFGLPDFVPPSLPIDDVRGRLDARNNLMASTEALGTLLTDEQRGLLPGSPWLV